MPPEVYKELKLSFTKHISKTVDMGHELQSEVIDVIISAIDSKKGNYEQAARAVKEQMDRKYGPSWHCIVGEGYGFQITYQTKHMIFVYYQGNIAILLYKC